MKFITIAMKCWVATCRSPLHSCNKQFNRTHNIILGWFACETEYFRENGVESIMSAHYFEMAIRMELSGSIIRNNLNCNCINRLNVNCIINATDRDPMELRIASVPVRWNKETIRALLVRPTTVYFHYSLHCN